MPEEAMDALRSASQRVHCHKDVIALLKLRSQRTFIRPWCIAQSCILYQGCETGFQHDSDVLIRHDRSGMI